MTIHERNPENIIPLTSPPNNRILSLLKHRISSGCLRNNILYIVHW